MNLSTFVAVALLVGVTACGSNDGGRLAPSEDVTPTAKPTPTKTLIEQAWDWCGDETSAVNNAKWSYDSVEMVDDGHSLLFDSIDSNKGFKALGCLLSELETTDATVSNMNSTTSMMGRQQAVEGNLTYQWTYHPDNGFDMTITEVEDES